ncbi:MAG TPA: hypothetical protein VG104_01855 [Candidatus Dormibacteraeota bacterium]|nr:hypothetical protein [Candidatus Dormibacteraeota bacterium]
MCRDDAKNHVFVLEVYPADGALYGLAVEDALYCGVCKPKAEPVRMDFLEGTDHGRPKKVPKDTPAE